MNALIFHTNQKFSTIGNEKVYNNQIIELLKVLIKEKLVEKGIFFYADYVNFCRAREAEFVSEEGFLKTFQNKQSIEASKVPSIIEKEFINDHTEDAFLNEKLVKFY